MEDREDTTLIELHKKPFRCLHCGISFGDTDGIRLYCGEYAMFTLKVTPTCRKCGEPRTWRPVALMKDRHFQSPVHSVCPGVIDPSISVPQNIITNAENTKTPVITNNTDNIS